MNRPVAAALLAAAALRLGIIGAVGLGDDEAYYALWARRLDLSYFDHPPGAALLIRASTALLGETSFAVRLPTVLCGLGAAWVLGRSTWAGPARGAAALLLLCSPLFALLGLFAAPDAPALLALLLSVEAAWTRRWAAAGLWAGLGLLCKLTGLLWGLSLLLWLLWEGARGGERGLRQPGPWIGAGLALLGLLPTLLWNAQHDWVSFAFHLVGRHHPQPLTGLGTLLGSQIAFLGPLLLALLVGLRALWRDRLAPGETGRRARFLLCGSLPVLAVFGLSALIGDFKPHWLAPAWLLLLPAAAASLEGRPRLRAATLGLGALAQVLILGQALYPLLPLGKADLTHDLYGWDRVAAAVIAAKQGEARPSFVAGHMYQTAAQLGYALPPTVSVTRIGGGRGDQFDLWRPADLAGQDAIFVSHSRYDKDPNRLGLFTTCAPLPDVSLERGGAVVRVFHLWRCQGYQPR